MTLPAWPVLAAVLFVVSLAWRLSLQARLGQPPGLLTLLNADAKTYWRWASIIRENGWLGRNAFFMAPLYPYTLAALRAVVGDSIANVLHIQAVWGSLAVVLLADAVRRLTRPAIGFAVGLLLAGYTMCVLMDSLVLGESLLFFLESLLLWFIVREDWRSPRSWALVTIGALIGLMAHGRATGVLLLLPLPLLARASSATWRTALAKSAPALLAALALCAPVAIRHGVLTREWIPYTYNAGYNLYVGNGPEATGTFAVPTGSYDIGDDDPSSAEGGVDSDGREFLRTTAGVELGPNASSRYWTSAALREMRRNPGRWLALEARKLGMLWNWREYPQIYSANVYRVLVGPLGWPLLGSFALFGVLGLAGIWSAWRTGPVGRYVVASVAVTTLGVLPFFVVDRYRQHLIPALVLLSAITIERVLDAKQRRGFPTALCAGAAAAAIVVALPMPGMDRTNIEWNARVQLANAWQASGRTDIAGVLYREALAIVDRGELKGATSLAGKLATAGAFANAGIATTASGNAEEGMRDLGRALELAPNSISTAMALAELYATNGRKAEALELYLRVGWDSTRVGEELVRKAATANVVGDSSGTEQLLKAAMDMDPRLEVACIPLVRYQISVLRPEDARATLERGHAVGLAPPVYYAYLALIEVLEGSDQRARLALAKIPPEAEDDLRIQDALGRTRARLAEAPDGQ